MAPRKTDGILPTCLQSVRAWEKRVCSADSHTRTLVLVLCGVVFAYRLLQLALWSHSPALSRQAGSARALLAPQQVSEWLPNPWVGHPQQLDPLACTPQLLVIGAMKGGTTALFHYLNGSEPIEHYPNGTKKDQPPVAYRDRFHPAIIGSHVTKELHFFNKQSAHVRSPANQRAYFASFAGVNMSVDDPLRGKCSYPHSLGLASTSTPALVRMEATALYLAHPHAARNVKMLLPQARLVALLREPVSRALSSVNMLFQNHHVGLLARSPKYKAAWQTYVISELQRQLQTLKNCSSEVQPNLPYYAQMDYCVFRQTGTLQGVLHIHVGLYAVHLGRWFSYFEPRHLLLWSSHAFEENPRQHMKQLVTWLGLDPTLTQPESEAFKKLHERKYPSIHLPKSLFDDLISFFEPHNQRLFRLLEEKGYSGLVQQLKAAWALELQATVATLQRR